MSRPPRGAARAALYPFACALALASPPSPASAQVPTTAPPRAASGPPGAPAALPELVVTADRTPEDASRTGSAITVLPGERVERTNPASLVDALRQVPGLDVSETGGPGAVTSVRLRGASSGQTLVLIDGVRVGDPSGVGGDFDFSTLIPGAIDRIEVLRGPQSALYGSDAIGGVVNVLTRRAGEGPRVEARVEAGRYGTVSTSATISQASGPWSLIASGGAQRSDGFSRYGYRIGRLQSRFPYPFENDGVERFGGFGRLAYDAGEGVRLEFGLLGSRTLAPFDAAFGAVPDTPSRGDRLFLQGWAKAAVDALDGRWTNEVQVFANRTDRTNLITNFGTGAGIGGAPRLTSASRTEFAGQRLGAEYQSTFRTGDFGTLIAGLRTENEQADSFTTTVAPTPGARRRTIAAEQTTRSAFGLWRWPIGERLTLSLGGRVDDVVESKVFRTWRATAAYLLDEAGTTKLRASAGTGGKAPTLFQLFSPDFGTPGLRPEESIGVDAGLDQAMLDGRVKLSFTIYRNRLKNLIDFANPANCAPGQAFGCYFNVARARSSGVELSAEAVLVPEVLSLRGVYTRLDARDLVTDLRLARRAPDVGRVALAITPTPRVLIEPSVAMVSERFSTPGARDRLAPYARLDVFASYEVDAHWRVHARLENATNARYQEVRDYGTTGRALYGGLNAKW